MTMGDKENRDKTLDVFGCDIGNGFAYISLLESAKSDPVPMFPVNSEYDLGAIGMPTSAYVVPPDGDNIEVFDGRSSYDRHRREPDKMIHAVKTRLKEGKIPVPGISKPVSSDMIYAAVARDLIKLGNEVRKGKGEPCIRDIVFTFPAAYTNDISMLNRMQKSIEGITVEGKPIRVVGRLPEPAAVAIDYLFYMQNLAPQNVRLKDNAYTALVYDLGHGTFDTAVVTAKSKGEPYQLHFNAGLPEIGGKDFDQILYNEVCNALKIQQGYVPKNNDSRDRIKREAVEMKHELTESTVSVREIMMDDGEYAEVEISRELFEKRARSLINQTFELVEQMIQQADNNGMHIDAVVLSGGASQMPMVSKGLKELLEEYGIPISEHRPSEAVSYGAARFAYGRLNGLINNKTKEKGNPSDDSSKIIKGQIQKPIEKPILEKFTEYSYGIWLPSKERLDGIIEFLIDSKTKMPAKSRLIRITSPSGRVVIKLYRSLEKFTRKETLATNECVELIRIPFDVPSSGQCEISIVVLEDYNIKLMCRTEDGTVIEKSTTDLLGKLI